jgi:hypothetical protein
MASTTMQRRRWIVLVMATMASAGCGVEEHYAELHATGTRLSFMRPECPQTWDTIPEFPVSESKVAVRGVSPPPPPSGVPQSVPGSSALAASGPITDIPEFNDCQKFVIPEAGGVAAHYDSLYAIFAAFKMDSITSALVLDHVTWSSSNTAVATVSATGVVTGISVGTTSIIATSTVEPGRKAAMVVTVMTTAPQPPPTVYITNTPAVTIHPGSSFTAVATIGPRTTASLPAAEIYTYGPGDNYGPGRPTLGIGPNFNCLYLYFDSSGALTAKMVNKPTLGPGTKACFDVKDPVGESGTTLSVIRTPGFHPADYPAVARWDWDPVNQHQYVGIKCGDAWCEIGASGAKPFTPSGKYTATSGSGEGVARVLGIKGWYDQQFLAIPGDGGRMIPSAAMGTVIPDPGLDTVTKAMFSSGHWVAVAYVAIDPGTAGGAAATYYKHKFNFDPVAVQSSLARMNTLSLCYGTRDHCRVPKPTPPAVGCEAKQTSAFIWKVNRWWAKVESASHDKTMYRCVTRRDHLAALTSTGVKIPAATRWRWLANDETTWNYCDIAGCCQSNGDDVSRGWQ